MKKKEQVEEWKDKFSDMSLPDLKKESTKVVNSLIREFPDNYAFRLKINRKFIAITELIKQKK